MSYILVTGSNGFIASSLIEKLLNQGYKVLGISANHNRINHNNFKHLKADITECFTMEEIFAEYEISTVIHLAAIAHIKGRKDIDWNEFYRVNTLASKTIFKLSAKSNIDIIFASTVDVYGELNVTNITEECTPMPNSDYAQSKYLAEKILKEELSGSSSNYVIARFAPVYAERYMKDIYKRAYIKYPKIAYKIGAGYNYHFVSVNNVTDFVLAWLNSVKRTSGIFNISDNNLVNSINLLSYEKERGTISKVISIPAKLIPFINLCIKIGNKVIRNEKLKKIELNLYKLIKPPIYSNEKMKLIYNPRWDLENTVYKNEKTYKEN